MNPKSKYGLLLFTATALFLNACQPDPNIPDPGCNGCTQYHVSDVKKWLYFQPGTYWIYEEENSGAIDSVYVTSDTYDDGNAESAFFRCETFSTYYGYYFNYLSDNSSTCDNTFWGEKRCILVRRSKYYPGDFVGETVVFFYRPIVGNTYDTWSGPGLSRITVNSIYDTLAILTNNFLNVVEMDEERNITEMDQHSKIYITENFGIIKKELLDSNQVWNLVRYNIIQ